MPHGAFVQALVDGVFNDPDHRAQKAGAGDYLTVAGGWYVESLVKDGLVEQVSKEEYYRRMSEAERIERISGINEGGAIMHDWHEGQNMDGLGPHLTARLAELNPKLASDLDALNAALADANAPDEFAIAQNWSEVEPDSFPQAPEAALAEMTEIAQANGEYDTPPPAAPKAPAIPPGRIPESKVKPPQERKLVPERSGRRRG